MFSIINFYRFVTIDDPDRLKTEQMRLGLGLGLKGTILIAPEGVNVMLSGSKEKLEEYLQTLSMDTRFADIRVMWSNGETRPFRRLKVKVKNYIVVFDPSYPVTPDQVHTAPYMDSADWQKVIAEKPDDVVLLDTRNYYEYDYGTFAGAEQLDIKHFRQFPTEFLKKFGDQKDKTFLMFCTGGIRCEKAAVFAQQQGFEKVYQLDGGILKYFEEKGREGYKGSCFVFDHRWAVTPELSQSEDGPHPDQLDRVFHLA